MKKNSRVYGFFIFKFNLNLKLVGNPDILDWINQLKYQLFAKKSTETSTCQQDNNSRQLVAKPLEIEGLKRVDFDAFNTHSTLISTRTSVNQRTRALKSHARAIA